VTDADRRGDESTAERTVPGSTAFGRSSGAGPGSGLRGSDQRESTPPGSTQRDSTQWESPESFAERTLGTLASLNPVLNPVLAEAPPAPAGPASIDDLYRSHRMGMVRLAILLVDDVASAEDVVQEAFAGLYRNWGGLRDTAAAIGYLRTAVVNGSRSMLRRRRTARAYVPPDPGTARSAESLAMMGAEHRAVVAALHDLPPRQREVLVLRYYGGLSEAEIAEATGLSKGTVKSTASRAVAKLGDAMRAGSE
jgi:RNA polymerase sigma-70 factor (sigma-E family)